jgi:hypothetical protein
MRIEYKGFVVTQLKDGRYYAVNMELGLQFIVDDVAEITEAIDTIEA